MKKLRQRLLALPPRDKDEVLPAAFYRKHGFSAADANDIMAQWADLGLEDEEGEIAETALIHAWSILAILGGKEGRGFLIEELGVACSLGDDLFLEAFADLVFAAGPEAVPQLIANLGDGREGEDVLVEIASALTGFARHDIERDAILDAQAGALRGDPLHRQLKAFIIADLIELSSDTYLPEIRKAFEENLVNVSVTGDLEEVEIELGLRSERSGPQPRWSEREAKLAREALERRLGPRPAEGDDAGILRYYLERHRGPRSFRNLVEFDGLMLGTILAPTLVRPSRYLSAIWDPENNDHDPGWDSQEDARLFFTAVMNWHNGIIRRLDEGTYSPPFEPRSEPRVPTEDEISWTRGLIGSVMLWESGSADSSEIHQALIAAAMHLVNPSDDTPDAELIQVAHVVRGAHMLREALMGGGDRPSSSGDFEGLGGDPGAEIETYRREAPRIGRNDPCPCGSGLKYKRCCMN